MILIVVAADELYRCVTQQFGALLELSELILQLIPGLVALFQSRISILHLLEYLTVTCRHSAVIVAEGMRATIFKVLDVHGKQLCMAVRRRVNPMAIQVKVLERGA